MCLMNVVIHIFNMESFSRPIQDALNRSDLTKLEKVHHSYFKSVFCALYSTRLDSEHYATMVYALFLCTVITSIAHTH